MGVSDYSSTPASNTTINSIGIAGSNNVQNFDNAFRQLMADIATARGDGQMASMPYVAKSAGYTVAVTDRGKLIDCTAAVELELPAAATAGAAFYFIAKANGGAVTLDPNGTENINGSSTSATVADGSSAIVVCDGTGWYTITIGSVSTTGTETLTNKTLTTPTLTLKQGAAAAPTAEGDIQWDTDDNRLVIGDGAATQTFTPNPASTAAGDVEYYTAANTKARLAKGGKGQSLRQNSAETAPEWGGPGIPDAVLEDQKAAGTDGGTFTSGAWQTRDLNTEVRDAYGLVSISSNAFTPTVNGWVEWSAPAFAVAVHKTRLYNVTDSTVAGVGASSYAPGGDNGFSWSGGGAPVVAGKAYRVEHQAQATNATDGFGLASGFSTVEVYTRVKFWRS